MASKIVLQMQTEKAGIKEVLGVGGVGALGP